MTYSNRLLGLVLLLGSGASLAAQPQDASLEKSIVTVSTPMVANRPEYCRGLLISEKGLVLTTWRNVCGLGKFSCTGAGLSTDAKVIGVHPTRDLALLQIDLSKTNPENGPKPAKLAKASVSVADQVFLLQWNQPVPAVVSSETQPASNPECFWISGRNPKTASPWPDGWGGNQPNPDNWVTNLQGEFQGVVARVIVNGKMCLRVIPIHDIKPEDFVPPAQRRPNVQKAEELIRIADGIERDPQSRYRPVPVGTYQADAIEYIRLALAEDPTNKDLNFRLGMIRNDSKANSAQEARSLPDPTRGKTDEQVNDEFVRGRLAIATEHLKAGRLKVAQGILEDIISSYPKAPEAKLAQRLLDSLKDPK